jgi:hypothetical protein
MRRCHHQQCLPLADRSTFRPHHSRASRPGCRRPPSRCTMTRRSPPTGHFVRSIRRYTFTRLFDFGDGPDANLIWTCSQRFSRRNVTVSARHVAQVFWWTRLGGARRSRITVTTAQSGIRARRVCLWNVGRNLTVARRVRPDSVWNSPFDTGPSGRRHGGWDATPTSAGQGCCSWPKSPCGCDRLSR